MSDYMERYDAQTIQVKGWAKKVHPAQAQAFIKDVERDLATMKQAIDDNDWNQVLKLMNTIHLDAKENRDYLYRVRDNSNVGF